jgi:hypothetical protein
MPAAPTELVAAVRAGTCARHHFFKMTHTSGTVLAWDGVGDFVFNGDTYLGVASLMEIGGVSNSADIQNHAVSVKLNGVPLSDFRGVEPSIRGQTALLYAVWISVDTGIVLGYKLLFSGLGDYLTTRFSGDTVQLAANIRAPHADWSVVPRAYYTGVDQARLYPGDTGCDLVSRLENAVIAGWQATPGSVADLLYYRANMSLYRHIADADGNLYGHATYGPVFQVGGSGELLGADSSNGYYDSVLTSNQVTYQSLGQAMLCNGVSVQLNGSDEAISADGNYITRAHTGSAGDRLRKIGTIASAGTPSADRAKFATYFGIDVPVDSSNLPSGENYSGLYFPASGTHYARRDPSGATWVSGGSSVTLSRIMRSDGAFYVEDGTSYGCCFGGGANPYLYVYRGGSTFKKLVRSSTGALVTEDTGAKVVVSGEPDSYLRLWT